MRVAATLSDADDGVAMAMAMRRTMAMSGASDGMAMALAMTSTRARARGKILESVVFPWARGVWAPFWAHAQY